MLSPPSWGSELKTQYKTNKYISNVFIAASDEVRTKGVENKNFSWLEICQNNKMNHVTSGSEDGFVKVELTTMVKIKQLVSRPDPWNLFR